MDRQTLVLLTGASGYVGGRLLKVLESAGQPVRCLARRPEFLLPKVGSTTQIIAGDVLDRGSLVPALSGVDTAYYLVHSMTTEDFEEATVWLRKISPTPRRKRRFGRSFILVAWVTAIAGFATFAQPSGGRKNSAFFRKVCHRVSCFHHYRLGQPIFRNDPGARGKAPGDDYTQVGRRSGAASGD